MDPVGVYLEIGSKRAFAAAIDWPGWCRSARDSGTALQALVDYGTRYTSALGTAARALKVPSGVEDLKVIEKLKGDATTDFGAPSIAPKSDSVALDDAELSRLQKILRASWAAFDSAAERASNIELRKGPRGGGRDIAKMIAHVLEADRAYLGRLGGARVKEDMEAVRTAIIDAITARAHGEPPAPSKRTAPLWLPRYGVRRSAWHALDHAWEIQDRSV